MDDELRREFYGDDFVPTLEQANAILRAVASLRATIAASSIEANRLEKIADDAVLEISRLREQASMDVVSASNMRERLGMMKEMLERLRQRLADVPNKTGVE